MQEKVCLCKIRHGTPHSILHWRNTGLLKSCFDIFEWPTLCCIMHMIKYYEFLGSYVTISTIYVAYEFLRNFLMSFFQIHTQIDIAQIALQR